MTRHKFKFAWLDNGTWVILRTICKAAKRDRAERILMANFEPNRIKDIEYFGGGVMNQRSLFDASPEPTNHYGAPVRRSDPQTSKDAAAKAGKSLCKDAELLLSEIRASAYPITIYEAAENAIAFTEDRTFAQTTTRRDTLRKRIDRIDGRTDRKGNKVPLLVRKCGKRECRVKETELDTYEAI